MAGKNSVPGSKRAHAQHDLIGEKGKQDGKRKEYLTQLIQTASPAALLQELPEEVPAGKDGTCSPEPSTAPSPGPWETSGVPPGAINASQTHPPRLVSVSCRAARSRRVFTLPCI